jgi:hypothetical protein
MPEVAIAVPFDANEIKDILGEEFRKRLDQLGPLQGAKEYCWFAVNYQIQITLRRTGELATEKKTLAWGNIQRGAGYDGDIIENESVSAVFESDDPNKERMARGMPLTVEASDGHGGKVRKRVTVKE